MARVKQGENISLFGAALLCIALLSGCQQQAETKKQLSVEFVPFYGDKPIRCDGTFSHGGIEWQINTLSFYVSAPKLEGLKIQQQIVDFIETEWQTPDVAMLWFASICDQSSTENRFLSFNTLANKSFKDFTKFTFSIGIPFEQNHANPLLQASPLNISEMFWSWRNGHKFMRIDLKASESSDNWALHLGSIGCQSQSSLRSPEMPCTNPNKFSYSVDLRDLIAHDTLHFTIKFDLALLFENIELSQDNACMFDYTQRKQCKLIVENMAHYPIFSLISQNLDEQTAIKSNE